MTNGTPVRNIKQCPLHFSAKEPLEWLRVLMIGGVTVLGWWLVLRLFIAGRAVSLAAVAFAVTAFEVTLRTVGTGNSNLLLQGWIFAVIALAALAVWLGVPAKIKEEGSSG